MGILYNELTLSKFEKLISDTNSSILCGNGLSINFDNRLSMNNLGKSLYNAHCTWKAHSNYRIISNATFKDGLKTNYSGAKKVINRIKSEEDLENFFKCAISFASQIVEESDVVKWLNDNGFNSNLVFGVKWGISRCRYCYKWCSYIFTLFVCNKHFNWR